MHIYLMDEVPRSQTFIDTNSNIALEIKSKVMVTYESYVTYYVTITFDLISSAILLFVSIKVCDLGTSSIRYICIYYTI